MNPFYILGGVGAYFLLSGRARALGEGLGLTDWSALSIEELSTRFAGKKVGDVPPVALERLRQHAVERVNAGPVAPGIYGEKLLTPVPGQNAGDGQPIYFFRWSATERLRDMAALVGSGWKDPGSTLHLVAIKGQPRYGFWDKAAGDIKQVVGAIGGGAIGFVAGGPAGAAAGAKAGGTLIGRL